jgi:hypothetical protein
MCGLLCSEKTIAPLYIVGKMRLRLAFFIMVLVGWVANADRPLYRFLHTSAISLQIWRLSRNLELMKVLLIEIVAVLY